MNSKHTLLISCFFLCLSFGLQAQESPTFKEKYFKPDKSKFKEFVNEAYGPKAGQLVFDHWTRRLILKDYFTKRMTIVERNKNIPIPDWFQELSTIDTYEYTQLKGYNKSEFDPKAFNPFFYKIDYLESDKVQHIHISGTNYYIKILPFNIDVINKEHQKG